MKSANLSETIQKIHSPLTSLRVNLTWPEQNRIEYNNDIFKYPLIVQLLNQYKHELVLSYNPKLECPIAIVREQITMCVNQRHYDSVYDLKNILDQYQYRLVHYVQKQGQLETMIKKFDYIIAIDVFSLEQYFAQFIQPEQYWREVQELVKRVVLNGNNDVQMIIMTGFKYCHYINPDHGKFFFIYHKQQYIYKFAIPGASPLVKEIQEGLAQVKRELVKPQYILSNYQLLISSHTLSNNIILFIWSGIILVSLLNLMYQIPVRRIITAIIQYQRSKANQLRYRKSFSSKKVANISNMSRSSHDRSYRGLQTSIAEVRHQPMDAPGVSIKENPITDTSNAFQNKSQLNKLTSSTIAVTKNISQQLLKQPSANNFQLDFGVNNDSNLINQKNQQKVENVKQQTSQSSSQPTRDKQITSFTQSQASNTDTGKVQHAYRTSSTLNDVEPQTAPVQTFDVKIFDGQEISDNSFTLQQTGKPMTLPNQVINTLSTTIRTSTTYDNNSSEQHNKAFESGPTANVQRTSDANQNSESQIKETTVPNLTGGLAPVPQLDNDERLSNASPIYKADLQVDDGSETQKRDETDVFYGKLGLEDSTTPNNDTTNGFDLIALHREEIMTILEQPSTNQVSEMASKASSFEAQSDTARRPGNTLRSRTHSMNVLTEKDGQSDQRSANDGTIDGADCGSPRDEVITAMHSIGCGLSMSGVAPTSLQSLKEDDENPGTGSGRVSGILTAVHSQKKLSLFAEHPGQDASTYPDVNIDELLPKADRASSEQPQGDHFMQLDTDSSMNELEIHATTSSSINDEQEKLSPKKP